MAPRPNKADERWLSGAKYRATHQSTVDAVLGAGMRSVRSMGANFYNKDKWPARQFTAAFCKWAKNNPSTPLTEDTVRALILVGNEDLSHWEHPEIVIASTPDNLSVFMRDALVGGGYHEAWHTEYSRRKNLIITSVWPRIQTIWDLVPNWAPYVKALLTWGNIIEDIRIERCGCRKYPGAPRKMEALQDLILTQEEKGREAASHRGLPTNDDMAAVIGTFRDLGLGYDTTLQNAAYTQYERRSPQGYALVTEGPLKALLDRAIALGPNDDMEHLWLAMEVVAVLVALGGPADQPGDDEGDDGDGPGEPKEATCPSCGSKDVVLQPSKKVIHCNACGFEQELQEGGGGGGRGESVSIKVDPNDPGAEDQEGESGESGESGDGEGQPGDGESGDGESGQGGSGKDQDKKLPIFKVGDRAKAKSGPYAGKMVEVTSASQPDSEGRQDLQFAVVEDAA